MQRSELWKSAGNFFFNQAQSYAEISQTLHFETLQTGITDSLAVLPPTTTTTALKLQFQSKAIAALEKTLELYQVMGDGFDYTVYPPIKRSLQPPEVIQEIHIDVTQAELKATRQWLTQLLEAPETGKANDLNRLLSQEKASYSRIWRTEESKRHFVPASSPSSDPQDGGEKPAEDNTNAKAQSPAQDKARVEHFKALGQRLLLSTGKHSELAWWLGRCHLQIAETLSRSQPAPGGQDQPPQWVEAQEVLRQAKQVFQKLEICELANADLQTRLRRARVEWESLEQRLFQD